jgi:hypothetical protein
LGLEFDSIVGKSAFNDEGAGRFVSIVNYPKNRQKPALKNTNAIFSYEKLGVSGWWDNRVECLKRQRNRDNRDSRLSIHINEGHRHLKQPPFSAKFGGNRHFPDFHARIDRHRRSAGKNSNWNFRRFFPSSS